MERQRTFGWLALAGGMLAMSFAACRPPEQADNVGKKAEHPQTSLEALAGPAPAVSAPQGSPSPRFAENLVAVGFTEIGEEKGVVLLNRATRERFLASSSGPAYVIRVVEIRRTEQSVLLSKGDATATVPLELRSELAGNSGEPASTNVQADTSVQGAKTAPVFSSATDGMSAQEIAATPVFQSAEDPTPKAAAPSQ